MAETSREAEAGTSREILRHLKLFSRLHLKEIPGIIEETCSEWNNDNAQRLGASLAFFTLLSLAPLVVVIVAVGAAVFGPEAAEGQFAWEIRDLVGPVGAQAIQEVIRGAYKPQAGVIATILSLLTLIFGATSVAVELHEALNMIWHVPVSAGKFSSRVADFVKERFFSLLLVLGAGFVLVVSLIWSVWIVALGRYVGSLVPLPAFVLHLATFFVSFITITLIFAAIYKFVPDEPLKWRDVIVGACFTALVFTIGKQLLALYLGKLGLGSAYGAAGSLVTVLVWVYYSAQLFFLGAEFTKIYARRYGSHFARKLELAPQQPPAVVLAPDGRSTLSEQVTSSVTPRN
ncbi:MAG TPA: YihY/virulence factor BrkB family protein [Bryobacteraceae bacterium]|jgi:membrane protein|nr:YihY/virulence factor BrkB family protein [Bryobacteraceae bacterium]